MSLFAMLHRVQISSAPIQFQIPGSHPCDSCRCYSGKVECIWKTCNGAPGMQCTEQIYSAINLEAFGPYHSPVPNYTEFRKKNCTWLRDISSCSWFTLLPPTTLLLLNMSCKTLFRALCILPRMRGSGYIESNEKTTCTKKIRLTQTWANREEINILAPSQ